MLIMLSLIIAYCVIIDMLIVYQDAIFVFVCHTCGKRWGGPIPIVIILAFWHKLTGCGLGES